MNVSEKGIIVTGGCGFIGSHLVDHLLTKNPRKIIVIDNLFHGPNQIKKIPEWPTDKVEIRIHDAQNWAKTKQAIEDIQAEIVFNLAVAPLPHSLIEPEENFKNNVDITLNLLDLLQRGVYKRLVHFSSSEVYGSCQIAPMDETHPLSPSTVYAASKAACDLLVQSYVKTHGCNAVIIRPFNNYGPRQNEGTYAGVIPRTITRLMRGEKAEIYGSGFQTRDYIFVKDTAEAAIIVAEKGVAGEVYNVSSEMAIQISYLIAEIIEMMASKGWIKNNLFEDTIDMIHEWRVGDVMNHIGDCKKLKALGYKPQTDFLEGLEKTIEYYCGSDDQ